MLILKCGWDWCDWGSRGLFACSPRQRGSPKNPCKESKNPNNKSTSRSFRGPTRLERCLPRLNGTSDSFAEADVLIENDNSEYDRTIGWLLTSPLVLFTTFHAKNGNCLRKFAWKVVGGAKLNCPSLLGRLVDIVFGWEDLHSAP